MTQPTNERPNKTKLLLAAPLVVIPFCALFFHALGGGKGTGDKQQAEQPKGLNTYLPSPKIKDTRQDKLSLYEIDEKDSASKQKQHRGSLDLFEMETPPIPGEAVHDEQTADIDPYGRVTNPFSSGGASENRRRRGNRAEMAEQPADELERKLNVLRCSLQHDTSNQPEPAEPADEPTPQNDAVFKQLDAAMAAIKDGTDGGQPDRELGMMSGMLDKILDIQHPDRVKNRLEKQTTSENKGMRVAAISTPSLIDPLLQATDPSTTRYSVSTKPQQVDGFYELGDPAQAGTDAVPSIAAVVHGTQTLVNGASLEIRLDQDVYVRGQLIPKGTSLHGKCSLSGERLQVSFNIIRHGQLLFPVDLEAYGLDGIPGIRIPGSITRDAAKQGTNEAIQAIGLSTMDPSLTAQATAAGLDAAKTLLTKKVKLVKVTVKTDCPLLLRDGTKNNK
ncbi:conjugative transposon protein TraM [Pseudoflavitalea sp. X16]|uniref:conjugative transposon protein TraM n=1 Tax=Paraflavitalea devenefica TaxID=2716334 RepID=UPI001422D227|nr:conjugative transposon protein TraM [Paraflavitalea devenefica]NII26164.1 conjugative transposon protein TraM [Paraflavitalea devenefica]